MARLTAGNLPKGVVGERPCGVVFFCVRRGREVGRDVPSGLASANQLTVAGVVVLRSGNLQTRLGWVN